MKDITQTDQDSISMTPLNRANENKLKLHHVFSAEDLSKQKLSLKNTVKKTVVRSNSFKAYKKDELHIPCPKGSRLNKDTISQLMNQESSAKMKGRSKLFKTVQEGCAAGVGSCNKVLSIKP